MKSIALLFLAVTSIASAQSYSIDWYTIDGGGGTSTGGVYTVTGTIGQPDAGTLSGGSYTLNGGFWSIFAVQTPGAPLLSVARSGANVIVSWLAANAAGFVLDQSATLTGAPIPWSQVGFPYNTNSGVISITVPSPAGNKYYRLRHP